MWVPHQSKLVQPQELNMVGFRLCYSQGSKCWEMGLAIFPLLCDV